MRAPGRPRRRLPSEPAAAEPDADINNSESRPDEVSASGGRQEPPPGSGGGRRARRGRGGAGPGDLGGGGRGLRARRCDVARPAGAQGRCGGDGPGRETWGAECRRWGASQGLRVQSARPPENGLGPGARPVRSQPLSAGIRSRPSPPSLYVPAPPPRLGARGGGSSSVGGRNSRALPRRGRPHWLPWPAPPPAPPVT